MLLSTLFLLLTTANSAAGAEGDARKLDIMKYLPDCKIRYDRINLLKHTCEEVLQHQKLCQQPLTVSYSSLPPYVFKDDNGKVVGLLPGKLLLNPNKKKKK